VATEIAFATAAATRPVFALGERADLVLAWRAEHDLHVQHPDGARFGMPASPHVVACALAGGYVVERRPSADDGEAVAVEVRALPFPRRARLAIGGTCVLEPALVTTDDPRGPIADAVVSLPSTGILALRVELSDARDTPRDELFALLAIDLHGPRGRVTCTMTAPRDVPGALDLETELVPAGEYVVRVMGGPAKLRAAKVSVLFAAHPSVAVPPAAPLASGDGAPTVTTAAAAPVAVHAVPWPQAARAWMTAPGGCDVALTWTPLDLDPFLDRGEDSAESCDVSPFVVVRPGERAFALGAMPRETAVPIGVRARLLPLPEPAATLDGGGEVDVTTRAMSVDDPRGAFAEVVFAAERAGEYQITALDDRGRPAELEVYELAGGHVPRSDFDAGSRLGRVIVVIDEPRRVVVRLPGEVGRPARTLRVAVAAY
jgi:hypothetical protein